MKNSNDTRLKILSIIVAIFMWTYVVNTTNPSVNKTLRVPVILKNQEILDKNNYVITNLEDNYTTNVKLKGGRERIATLKSENIYAYVDLANAREGIQSLKIDVETPSGVSADEAEPSQINFNIQKLIEKDLPVNTVISESLKEGRKVEVNELSPSKLRIKGPASLVNKVDRLEVKIEDLDLIDGKIHNVGVSALDRSGNVVDGVRLSHEDVNISFFVYLTKSVPLKLFTSGSINSEYEEISRTLNPDSVIIKGPESIIKDIDELTTKPVNINNIKSTAIGEVKLNLPDAVEVYNGENTATYKIEVQKKKESSKSSNKEDENENEDDESRWYPK